jgi:zinc and cadmium transporter
MASPQVYAIMSVILVSLISLIGAVTLLMGTKRVERLLLMLVSLSAGTLLGGAFLHLIPEAVEEAGVFSAAIGLLVLAGIAVFFLLDKLIHWKHHHAESSLLHTVNDSSPSMAYLNLIGDGFHNLLDGLIIAGSYLVSIPTGVAATIAVIIHETPQEIADFGVLMYAGFSRLKALMFNFLSATLSIAGALIGLVLGANTELFIKVIVPFAAGAFIYIAASNLLPEVVKKRHGFKMLLLHAFFFIAGILVMYILLLLA